MAQIFLTLCSSYYLVFYQSLCYPIFNAYFRLWRNWTSHWTCAVKCTLQTWFFNADWNMQCSQKVKLTQRLKSALSDHKNYTVRLQFSVSEIFFLRFFLLFYTKWELFHFLEMSLNKFPALTPWWWFLLHFKTFNVCYLVFPHFLLSTFLISYFVFS